MSSFWNGYSLDNFLIHGLTITSYGGFTGVFIGVLSAAIIYEGIRTLRDFLFNRFLNTRRTSGERCVASGNEGVEQSSGNFDSVLFVKSSKSKNSTSDTSDTNGSSNGNGSRIGNGKSSTTTDDKNADKIEEVILPNSDPNISANSCKPAETCTATRQKPKGGILFLAVSSLLHMIYVCLGYSLMLAVMTYNVWILVAVVIGVAIGFFFCDMIRRTDLAKNSHLLWLYPDKK